MQSLSEAFGVLGFDGPLSLRDSPQSSPLSAAEVIRIARLPKPPLKRIRKRRVHSFTAERAQGIAFGSGSAWYLTTKDKIFKYRVEGSDLYNPASVKLERRLNLADVVEHLDPERLSRTGNSSAKPNYSKIGDVDFYEGLLFLSSGKSGFHSVVLALSEDLDLVAYSTCESATHWCSINPWDGHLYLGAKGLDYQLDLYDISRFRDVHSDSTQWGVFVDMPKLDSSYQLKKADGSLQKSGIGHTQGIAFSPNGRLYLSRYDETKVAGEVVEWTNFIYVYETMTGRRLSASDEIDFPGLYDEIEGLSVHPGNVIYVAVADHDVNTDEFEIYAFQYKDQIPV